MGWEWIRETTSEEGVRVFMGMVYCSCWSLFGWIQAASFVYERGSTYLTSGVVTGLSRNKVMHLAALRRID